MPRMLIAGIVRRLVLDREAGREAREVLEILDAEVVEELAVVGGQRERHLDRPLLAQLGGDDDLILVLGRRRRRRLGRSS